MVHEDDRPLLLVVCSDSTGLTQARTALRALGFLPVSGRSASAAIGLLSQVRVDGCVLLDSVTEDEAADLAAMMERFNPGAPRICIAGYHGGTPDDWIEHPQENWAANIAAVFGLPSLPASEG